MVPGLCRMWCFAAYICRALSSLIFFWGHHHTITHCCVSSSALQWFPVALCDNTLGTDTSSSFAHPLKQSVCSSDMLNRTTSHISFGIALNPRMRSMPTCH
ncbi:hypothetical protein BC835DRAFT_1023707 [Cytidiella melzeri]|nr:hypothetical protein BC835DRAFT_1023707 [Cytidiella melzeri]